MNETIVQLIRAARGEKGLTQKDLADHLGKTPAAISDLERGKVQVSASELYQIAELLNKPIEYFYGENIGDKEIQDLVAVLRKSPKTTRTGILQITGMLLRMQKMEDDARKYPSNQKVPDEMLQEFYSLFVPFATAMNEMSKKMNELRDRFDEELKLRELEKHSTPKIKGK